MSFDKIITEFAKGQKEGHFPCPRCGRYRMGSDPVRNALSRHATIYICNECGTDEAIRDFAGICLPLEEWAIAKNPTIFLRTVEACERTE